MGELTLIGSAETRLILKGENSKRLEISGNKSILSITQIAGPPGPEGPEGPPGGGGGGGASVTISGSAPGSPEDGDLWWNSADGNLYIYYDDGSSLQWVAATTAGSPPVHIHTQSSPSTDWVVNHNLGFRPSVEIYDAGGNEVMADVTHTSENQFHVYFAAAATGSARAN